MAANECGALADVIMACDDIGLNDYTGGISYNPAGDIILNVGTGIVIDRATVMT